MHPSSSPTSSTFLPSPTQSVIVDHLVPELVSATSTPPSSLLFSIPPTMSYTHSPAPSAIDNDFELTFTPPAPLVSSIDVECLRSLVTSATDCQSESEPASMSESSVSKFGLSPRALPLPLDQKLDLPPRALSPPLDCLLAPPISSSTLSSSPLPEISTLDSTLVAPSPEQPSSLSGSLSQLSKPRELETSTPISAADVVTLSHSELPLSPGEPILFLLSSLDAPLNAPISPRSTPPRLPELKTIGSVSTQLEVTPATPFVSQSQQPPLDFEVSSTLGPRFQLTSPPLPPSRSGLACFNFTFALVTTAVLVSTLINVSTALLTYTRKFWSKQDISDIRIDTLKASSCDAPFTYRLRLGQNTPRASRFVFDPGGLASVFRLTEDACKPKSKTCGIFIPCTTLDTGLPHSRSIDCLIVFDPGGVPFMLELAHEDSATFDEDVW
ncbi:hypothetical protein EDB89DRAFT_2243346 [Lactarius sanguifluus]|nr:hypothetical protein EDB89DRAFT_2243346 [Lactarius sanguifluus]